MKKGNRWQYSLRYKKSFMTKKENKVNKEGILRNIKNLFEDKKEENYYKPVVVINFWSNNYLKFES